MGVTRRPGVMRLITMSMVAVLAVAGCSGSEDEGAAVAVADGGTETDDSAPSSPTRASDGGDADPEPDAADEVATGDDDQAAGSGDYAPPADGVAPANLSEWLGLTHALLGPIDDYGEPFVATVDFFPEDISTPPNAGLEVFDLAINVDELGDREGVVTYPGLDKVVLQLRMTSTLTLDEFESFYDGAHPSEGPGWFLLQKETREQAGGTVLLYQFRSQSDSDAPEPQYSVIGVENPTTGGVDIDFSHTSFDLDDTTPLDRVDTMITDLPRVQDESPVSYRINAAEFSVQAQTETLVEGETTAVLDELLSLFPSGAFGEASAPEFNDILEVEQFTVACGDDALECPLEVKAEDDGVSRITFRAIYRVPT